MLLENGKGHLAEVGDHMLLMENAQYRARLDKTIAAFPYWNALEGKTIFLSGATGMLGSCLVDLLSVWNETQTMPCNIVAVSRNADAARCRFAPVWDKKYFSFCEQNVCAPLSSLPAQVDYIIHAASNADPVSMASYPADTLIANVLGTKNLLDYGMSHGMKRLLFVSSGEVYGQPNANLDDFTEDYCGPLDLSNPRSCYPSGKQAAEVLCQSYISQYGTDTAIVRPCHLFGPTMTRKDSRAVSEFLWSAVEGRDIVMKSAGLLERSHCYVVDAVSALLLVLLKGECGQAYNIADKQYQMTIGKFAQTVAEAGGCQVIYENPSELEQLGYSKTIRAVLDNSKLENLGWKPVRQDDFAVQETIRILQTLWVG